MRAEKILRCSCGRPYEFMNMMVGDQSKCPLCSAKEHRELQEAKRELEEFYSSPGERQVPGLGVAGPYGD